MVPAPGKDPLAVRFDFISAPPWLNPAMAFLPRSVFTRLTFTGNCKHRYGFVYARSTNACPQFLRRKRSFSRRYRRALTIGDAVKVSKTENKLVKLRMMILPWALLMFKNHGLGSLAAYFNGKLSLDSGLVQELEIQISAELAQ